MKVAATVASLVIGCALAGTVVSCQGQANWLNNGVKSDLPANLQPCTDYRTCCAKDKLKCTGDPDNGLVCTCSDLWSCKENPQKCSSDLPTPGGGGWTCSWTNSGYRCTKPGSPSDKPDGGGKFNCRYNSGDRLWICQSTFPPNPSNKPGGAGYWACQVKSSEHKLVCTRTTPGTPPGTTPPGGTPPGTTPPGGTPPGGTPPGGTPPGGTPPGGTPPGDGGWDCKQQDGTTVCTKPGGLPPGGGDFKCHQKTFLLLFKKWVCTGTTPPGGKPPGGGGWNCVPTGKTDGGKTEYRCEKPDGPEDKPPGGGHWSCAKGTEFKGNRCVKVPTPPKPPGLYPPPGEVCVPGQKRWCDGLQFCGWGQVTCLPSGKWPTRVVNGKVMLDCQELADGRRPNTKCACYHFYFNGDCCETPDCMVPKGSTGQICGKSPGKLCDFCNPQKPECNEGGARCMVNYKSGETYCGRACSATQPCPSGYACRRYSTKYGSSYQCMPHDNSCYY